MQKLLLWYIKGVSSKVVCLQQFWIHQLVSHFIQVTLSIHTLKLPLLLCKLALFMAKYHLHRSSLG